MGTFADQLARMPAERQQYTLSEVPAHLALAGQQERLQKLLTTADFLQAKLLELGPNPLILDYDLVTDQEAFSAIQDALRLATEFLNQNPLELPGQLVGRLMLNDAPEIQGLLDQAGSALAAPWFRPLSPCLASPGGPLQFTLGLPYHTPWSFSVTQDSRYLISGGPGSGPVIWDLRAGTKLVGPEETRVSVQVLADTSDSHRFVIVPEYPASSRVHLHVLDFETRALIRELNGHTGEVTAVAVTPDGRWAISASMDNTLCVWDLESGELLGRLSGHQDAVTGVVFFAQGKRAVSAGTDERLRIWDLESGEELQSRSVDRIKPSEYAMWDHPITALAITEDGTYLAAALPDATIHVWNLVDGTGPRVLTGHRDPVNSLAVIPGSVQLVSGSGLVANSDDNTVRLWDLEQGEELRVLGRHSRWVSAVAATPDGKSVLSGGIDNLIRVWNPAAKQVDTQVDPHQGTILGLAANASGRLVVSASMDDTLKVWSVKRQELVHTLTGHRADVNTVAVSPDGRYAYSGSEDGTLRQWDLNTGTCVKEIEGHFEGVTGLAMAPGGEYLASSSIDGAVRLWRPSLYALGVLELFQEPVESVAISGDGRRVVSACWNAEIRVSTMERFFRHHAKHQPTPSTDKPSSGRLRRLFQRKVEVNPYSVEPSRTELVFLGLGKDRLQSFRAETRQIKSMAVSFDGHYAAAGYDQMGVVEIWDLRTGQRLHQLRNGPQTFDLATRLFSQQLLVAAGDGTLSLWDMVEGKLLARLHLDVPCSACMVTRDGLVVAGDHDGRVHFLQLEGVSHGQPTDH